MNEIIATCSIITIITADLFMPCDFSFWQVLLKIKIVTVPSTQSYYAVSCRKKNRNKRDLFKTASLQQEGDGDLAFDFL